MTWQSAPSFPLTIYMAGDPDEAAAICQAFCDDVGFCVHLAAAHYIYTDGQEPGFLVGIINYPRFPAESHELWEKAKRLAHRLRSGLGQESFSIQGPTETLWWSERRP